MPTARKLAVLVLVLAGLTTVAYYAWIFPPSQFARRIADADRLVVTTTGREPSVRMTITGEELKRVIEMISRAHRDRAPYQATFDIQADFFKGPETLGQMRVCLQLMWIDGAQYRDDSGVLEKLVAMPILQAEHDKVIQK